MDYSGNIDIRIWAEINGFIEISDGEGDKSLLTPSEIQNFSIQKLNVLNTDYGFCSVFYAEKSYIVSLHFYASDKHSVLRHRDTVISIVVRRGYRISQPYSVLLQLRKKYEEVLANQSVDKGVKDLGFSVLQVLDSWKRGILKNIEKDDMQPFINLPGNANNQGYVACQNMLEMKTYLDYPLRVDFSGLNMIVFLLKNVVDNKDFKQLLPDFSLVKVELIYTRTFAVYFPSYQDAPIANITSLDEMLDFRFEKQYCEPIHLTGKYSEHMSDWKITPTDDRTGYRIGLQFQEKECRYKLNVKFIDLKGVERSALAVDDWLFPSFGKILCEDNEYWLVLKGSENEKLRDLLFHSKRENYKVGSWTVSNNVISFTVDEVFFYDVARLKNYIEGKYHFTPEVFLFVNNRWLLCKKDRIPLKGTPKEYRMRISESPDYEGAEFSIDAANIRLMKKPDLQFTFRFKGAVQRWLEANDRRYLTISELGTFSAIPVEYKLNLANNVLKIPASSTKKMFCLRAPGFKDEYIDLNERNRDIEIDMRQVWWRKIQKLWGMALFIGMSVGFIAGYIVGYFGHQKETTPSETVSVILKPTQQPSENDNSIYSIPVSGNDDRLQNGSEAPITDVKPSEPSKSVSVPAEKTMSFELEQLMEKLKGIEYTHGDLRKAQVLARKEGLYKKNKEFFDDVQFALYVATAGNRRNAAYVKSELSRRRYLSDAQKSVIEKIVEDELLYNTDNQQYLTIRDMYENYK